MPSKCVLANAPCPKTNDSNERHYCPAWWETTAVNDITGEVRIAKGCAWAQLPEYFNFLAREARGASVSAQNSRTAAEDLAGQLNNGFRAVALTLHASRHAEATDIIAAAEHRPTGSLRLRPSDPGDVREDRGSVE